MLGGSANTSAELFNPARRKWNSDRQHGPLGEGTGGYQSVLYGKALA